MQHGAAAGLFVQAVYRHNRQHLADGPGVGQALKHGKIAEIFIGQFIGERVKHLSLRALAGLQLAFQAVAEHGVQLLGQRFFTQRHFALEIEADHFGEVMADAVIGFGHHFTIIGIVQLGNQLLGGKRQIFFVGDFRHLIGQALDIGYIHHQHGMMRRHGAAGFRENARMRHIVFIAIFGQHRHNHMRIFADIVINRAFIARVGAVVIHAQAAAHVYIFNRQPQFAQLGKIAHRLFKAQTVIGNIGNLRAHVKMHQLHRVGQACGGELFGGGNQLRGGKAEFAFVAAGVGPFARSERREAHAQADIGFHAQIGRFFNHQIHFRFFFNHDKHLVPQALPHQGEADEFAVFIAVAHNGAAFGRKRQHDHQFRLGARFQPDGNLIVFRHDDVFHHRFLLVDLNRVNRRVAPLIIVFADGAVKRSAQTRHTVLQNIGKAKQHRQILAALVQLGHEPV